MTMIDTPSILVADDDPFIRRIFSLMLRRAGYRVQTAADGRETLEQIARQKPDLLILDYMMPYFTGLEVLDQLVLDPRTAAIPVLIVSAIVEENDLSLEPVVQEMTVAILAKPLSMKQLLTHVRQLLRQAHLVVQD